MRTLGAALVIVLAAGGAWLTARAAAGLVAAHGETAPQRVPVLGGLEPPTHAWNRYHARYYAMALLFLAFDMEMVFMYPWAVVFREEGVTAMVEMLMFIAILVLGILYAWRERALDWA